MGTTAQYLPSSHEQQTVKWTCIDTGVAEAQRNMEIDAELLKGLGHGEPSPILHLYSWKNPSATYGHFIDPHVFLQEDGLRKAKLDLARRPTGGGIIFHTSDFAFSFVIPSTYHAYSTNTLENYAFINSLVIDVLSEFTHKKAQLALLTQEAACDSHAQHFCMAKPTKYDVMLDGKKVGGGAQRRTKFGFLHQGSISLTLPDASLLESLFTPSTATLEAMRRHTCCLLEGPITSTQLEDSRQQLRSIIRAIVRL
jgi:lipoate-protein ligase A